MPEEGLEPTRPCGHWILSPATESRNGKCAQLLGDPSSREVPTLVPSPPDATAGGQFPADLGEVVTAWATRPDAIKAGVLALIRAAKRQGDVRPSA